MDWYQQEGEGVRVKRGKEAKYMNSSCCGVSMLQCIQISSYNAVYLKLT